MKRERILTLVLAGGKGSRLGPLTKRRAKPALPFAGSLRLIDFALSNCLHSGLSDVWVVEQYQLPSINDHLANGRPWDLDRTYGGLQVLPPYMEEGDEDGDGDSEQPDKRQQGGFAKGNADAIYRQRKLIHEFAPDLILVLSSDHVYRLDYQEVVARHHDCQADVTMVTTQVPTGDDASRFGVVQTDRAGLVTGFEYKPKHPQGDQITAEVFLYDAEKLLGTLDAIVAEGGKLEDYGDELLPRLVKAGRAWTFPLEGYWRDVGTVESYWQAHQELLTSPDKLGLDDPGWPILSHAARRLPARFEAGAQVTNSLVSPGCTIRGTVAGSVLAPGVVVEAGAQVVDSVVLAGVRIGQGAQVRNAILDENVEVGAGIVVGGRTGGGDAPAITVVGANAKLEKGQTISADEAVPAA